MANSARIISDSVNSRGHRLTTFIVTLARLMLAEFNTHRDFSRNSASSRAIPIQKMLFRILKEMFRPAEFGTIAKRMNAGPPLSGQLLVTARQVWDEAGLSAVRYALSLMTSPSYIEDEWSIWLETNGDDFAGFVLDIIDRFENEQHPKSLVGNESMLRVSKGLTNRILEPFMWHEIIVTATEFDNMFNLRRDSNAQLEIRTPALLMYEQYQASTPVELREGEWHLPFIQEDEREWAAANPLIARKAVTARCARVSYLTHDTGTVNIEADVRLSDSLAANGHMSPFEHAATPFSANDWVVRDKLKRAILEDADLLEPEIVNQMLDREEFSGNFRGFKQFRAYQPNQRVFQPAAA